MKLSVGDRVRVKDWERGTGIVVALSRCGQAACVRHGVFGSLSIHNKDDLDDAVAAPATPAPKDGNYNGPNRREWRDHEGKPAPKGVWCTCARDSALDNHSYYCALAAHTKPAEPVCTCDGTQSAKTCLKCSQEHPSKKYVLAQPEPAKGKPEYEYIKSDGTTDWGDSNPPGPKTGNVRSKEQGDIERTKPAKWAVGDKAEWVVGISHVVAGEIKAVWDEGAVFQAPGAAAAVVSFASGLLRRPLTTRKVRKQVIVREYRNPQGHNFWHSDKITSCAPTGRTHSYEVDE